MHMKLPYIESDIELVHAAQNCIFSLAMAHQDFRLYNFLANLPKTKWIFWQLKLGSSLYKIDILPTKLQHFPNAKSAEIC